jgi:hypothetical protein
MSTEDINKKEDSVPINKAESFTPVPRPFGMEKGQPHLLMQSGFIQDAKKKDLVMPQRLCTFDRMLTDDAVFNAVDNTNLHVVNALANGEFTGATPKGKIAAEFLNYNIHNMSYGTWRKAMQDAATDLIYGFSLLNIVTEVRTYGKYKGNTVLRKLSPRDQKSIYAWQFDTNNRELVAAIQKPLIKRGKFDSTREFAGYLTAFNTQLSSRNYVQLKTDNLLHFTFNSTGNNPQGDSPLVHCYDAWAEKKVVEKLEMIGISKDLGGVVVIKVPQLLIEQANNPAQYPDAALAYKQLQEDVARVQNGESTYIVQVSDVDEVTKTPLYDFKLQGIEGSGGKQYKTSDVIDQKRKSIYNTLGAGHLLLGQDSVGSYSMSTNAISTHGYYVERSVQQKVDVINSQLAPRLLAVNNIHLDFEDMPKFVPADPTEYSHDELSKVTQRMKSVGGLTPAALKYLYKKAKLPTEGIEDLVFDDGDTSRGGESNGTSGVGGSQAGGANSATNVENKALFRLDETGTTIFEDKEEHDNSD